MNAAPLVTISIVSHGQARLVRPLLTDLAQRVTTPHEVLLTLNIAEEFPDAPQDSGSPLHVLRNAAPKGFGANHNAAFRLASGRYFCVLNPDIRIPADPFPALIECLRDEHTGVAAPAIRDRSGTLEDSARRFPAPASLLRKLLVSRVTLDYAIASTPLYPDWVAGMFMLFRREAFAAVGGFDERYFLYYEDVDLCARLRQAGRTAVLCPSVHAIHDARRSSRRSLRHIGWHLASMLRFFASHRMHPGSDLRR